MMTDYGVNIPVMRQGNRFGGESNRLSQFLFVFGFCSLLIVVQSCSVQTPKLNHHYLPRAYSINSGILSHGRSISSSYKTIVLNDDEDFNARVVGFWRKGYFKGIIVNEHPYLKANNSDIDTVSVGLNRLFDIFYVTGLKASALSEQQLLSLDQKSENCRPLSNHEIQFMMNKSSEFAFPSISLTMLVVSSHELMMLKGGIPIYPGVLSTFLRKRFQLPGLKKISEANVFAEKIEGKLQLQKTEGFVFCRRHKERN